MLETIKLLLNISIDEKDALLSVLINQATQEALAYTHTEDAEALSNIIIKMVIYKFNRMGTEGLNSENYSGVSYSYTEDYSEEIIRELRTHRKLRTVC